MAPSIFERSVEAKPAAPRHFDGEVARMMRDEDLAFGLEQIVHPGKSTKQLPEELHVGKAVEPTPEEEKKEETFLT